MRKLFQFLVVLALLWASVKHIRMGNDYITVVAIVLTAYYWGRFADGVLYKGK